MDPRAIARFTAASRVAIGAAFVAYPPVFMRPWLGRDASRTSTVVLARALGARDLVLGAGALATMRDAPALRRWLAAAIVADGADFAVTLAAGDKLPATGRTAVLAIAGGAVALGAAAVGSLD